MALDFAIDADGVVHLTARNDQTGHAVVGSMRAPSGMTTDEIKHYAELFRTRWLVEVERDGETSAKKELGKVVAKLREQAGGCTDEIEAGRLTRIIEHASELLDSGNGTEVHRMLSWLRSRFGRPAADRSRGDEPAAQVDRSP
jgi:molecular chaperone DnaK (HSP70)